MPRSSAQSDFVIVSGEGSVSPQLPPEADPVTLPKAIWRTHLASSRATTLVYWFVFLTLGMLLVLTVVGPHIPAGE